MNPVTLERSRAVLDQLRQISDTVSSWVETLGPDPWPGRRSDALVVHAQLQHALQEARTQVGALSAILAQDEAP